MVHSPPEIAWIPIIPYLWPLCPSNLLFVKNINFCIRKNQKNIKLINISWIHNCFLILLVLFFFSLFFLILVQDKNVIRYHFIPPKNQKNIKLINILLIFLKIKKTSWTISLFNEHLLFRNEKNYSPIDATATLSDWGGRAEWIEKKNHHKLWHELHSLSNENGRTHEFGGCTRQFQGNLPAQHMPHPKFASWT